MAIVKATYTKSKHSAKASIRYIQHRPGRDGAKVSRILFGSDGAVERAQAYRMIDEAAQGSIYFRFVVSPDPQQEDTQRDLELWDITQQTMQQLEDRVRKPIHYVAAVHDDHAPHRHVHVVACVPARLGVRDFQAMRQTATAACERERQARDLAREARAQEQEAQWEL